MTRKTRNWLITLLILSSPFLFFLGLLFFWNAEPLPPVAPLPNPNGYDALAKAGKAITTDVGDYVEMNEAQLRELVTKNAAALQLLRSGLTNQCRVPLQFSDAYMANHLDELAGFKRLAQFLGAEGRLAAMEGRPTDAAEFYLDAIHLGTEAARGGVVIDQLVGTAIEAIGVAGLQQLVKQLDAESCRDTARTLETLDAQSQSWDAVMQQERGWSRRAYPGMRYELVRIVSRKSLNKAVQKGEERFNKQRMKLRQLMIAFAARAYELDNGKPPATVSDLVPDYLKTVPQDPVTGTNMVLQP